MVKVGHYSVKQPSIFGRIGQNLGQNLAEQLPKEIERGRLAAGINQFQKNASNMNPLEAATDLISKGVSPEYIYALQPLLQQMRSRQEGSARGRDISAGKKSLGISEEPEGINTTEDLSKGARLQEPIRFKNVENPSESVENPGITDLESEQALLKPNLPPTRDQILAGAAELEKNYPGLYPNYDQYIADVQQKLQSEYEQREALRGQSKINDQVKSEIDSEMNKVLGELSANIPGEYLQMLRNKAYEDVSSGERTKLGAANHYGKEALKLSKGLTLIDEIGQNWFPSAKGDRKSTRLNSSHFQVSRMPSSA